MSDALSARRISTPRLVLEPLRHEVAVAIVAGDLSGVRRGDGWPHADTLDGLRGFAEHGEAGGDGGWLITLRDDGRVIGDCGWRGGPDAAGEVLLGYGLALPARGQGLGTEAVAVLCAWAERQPGVERLVAEVHADNAASRRLLRRLGFSEQADDPPWVRCVRGPGEQPRIRGKHVC